MRGSLLIMHMSAGAGGIHSKFVLPCPRRKEIAPKLFGRVAENYIIDA